MALEIVYFHILGKPLIFWGGIITFISLGLTLYFARKNRLWHIRFGWLTGILALGHGILGLLIYL